MIAKFISNIKIDTNSFKKNPVNRNYYIEENGNTIATGWVKDLTYFNAKAFIDDLKLKNYQDRDGRFVFNNKEYHIGGDVRWGSEWPFFDENDNKIMSLWDDTEYVDVEVKKLFSKEKVMKKRAVGFQRIIISNDTEYLVYSISFGQNSRGKEEYEGEYYIIYKNNQVVSTIHVDSHMHNYGVNMDLYIEDDEETVLVTFLYCFLLVMYSYYHNDTTTIHENGSYTITRSKSKDYKLNKFSKDFIDRIKAESRKSIKC